MGTLPWLKNTSCESWGACSEPIHYTWNKPIHYSGPIHCSSYVQWLKSTYDRMVRENTGNKKGTKMNNYSDRNLYDTTTFRTINASYASFFLGCSNGAADLSTQVFQSFASWGWMWLAYFPSTGLSVCTLSAWEVLWVLWELSAVKKKYFIKGIHHGQSNHE